MLFAEKEVQSLTVAGSNLYWVSGQNVSTGAIRSVPIAGGTPTTIYADAHLQGDLASDGSRLYFTASASTGTGWEVDSVALDGTGFKSLATGIEFSSHTGFASELFAVSGNLYVGTLDPTTSTETVSAIPVGGGSPTPLVQGIDPTTGDRLYDVCLVDASGIYFFYQHGMSATFGYTPLAGGTASPIYAPPGTPVGASAADFTEVSGTAYMVADDASGASLVKIPTPSGPGTVVKTWAGAGLSGLIADSKGMFAVNASGSGQGIYRVDASTGAITPFWMATIDGPQQDILAMDSSNVYFATTGGGQYTVYKQAR